MDRSIQRLDKPVGSSGASVTPQLCSDPISGTHLGQAVILTDHEAGHMTACDPIQNLETPCGPGAVHIWILGFAQDDQ